MSYGFLDIAVTPSVREARSRWAARICGEISRATASLIALRRARPPSSQRAIASTWPPSETGWPYVQHRGGVAGFVKLIDDRTLAFADYRGNRQYISLGNVQVDDRAALIMVDYARRARLKIYVHIEAVALDADPALTARVVDPGSRAKPERILKLRLEAFDWNCPQHITPRFTEAETTQAVRPLRDRLAALKAENVALKAKFASRGE